MTGNQGNEKGFFRHLLNENSSMPTSLRGYPHEREVMASARRFRQEEATRHFEAQRSSTLHQVRTRFDDQASIQSSCGGSGDDDDDDDDDEYQGSVARPVD